MELFGALYDAKSYSLISPLVDGLVVYTNDFSSFYMNGLKQDEIIELLKKNEKKIIISIEFMLENEEVTTLTEYIKGFSPYKPYFIFSDLGVFQILKELGLSSYAIYNPNTLITNSYDMNFYTSCGMDAISLSLEITVLDQIKMLEKKTGKAFMELFGYHLMFHSKRELISLYSQFLNKDIKHDNFNSYLIEQTRKDKYHIYESNRGTTLFRPKITSYFSNLDVLKNLDYGFISNLFIDLNTYVEVLKIFKSYKDGNISLDDGQKKLISLKLEYQDGFKYQDTIYQKEKL